MPKSTDYLYIFSTICLTVYGQLILKWGITKYGSMPAEFWGKLKFLLYLLVDPAILSGIVAAFLASLAWMAAMTKFDLSYAYPFMSLNFVIVLLFSAMLLKEPLTTAKFVGIIFIIVGTIIASRQ